MSWLESLKDLSGAAKEVATTAAGVREEWQGAFSAGGSGSVAAAQAAHAAQLGAAQARAEVPAAQMWAAPGVSKIITGVQGNQGMLLLVALALGGFLLVKRFK